MRKYPKLLIVSHNSLSKYNNNGKTIETFFNEWPKDKISHLYFRPEIEDVDFCNNSFMINDYDALDNFIRIVKKPHYRIINGENKNESYEENYTSLVRNFYLKNNKKEKKEGIYKSLHENAIARKPFMCLIREIVWYNKRWFLKELDCWIEDFNPDVVFFQGSSSIFSYRIVNRIIDKYNLPLILQCTDDYTVSLYTKSLIEKFLQNKYLKIFKKTIIKAKAIYAISDKMVREYKTLYGGRAYFTLSNAVMRDISEKNTYLHGEYKFLYAGNLGLNRWKELAILGETLDELKDEGINIKLDVFSGSTLTNEIQDSFRKISSINFKGFIEPNELTCEISNTDFLVHVEAFDEHNRKVTRLSVSTKIGEYLGSKRCILAIGPKDVASMEYLKEKKLGITINSMDKKVIKREIKKIIFDPKLYSDYVDRAYGEYKLRYTQENINEIVYKSIIL